MNIEMVLALIVSIAIGLLIAILACLREERLNKWEKAKTKGKKNLHSC